MLELEIITTKKKISKSIIKQLEPAELSDIKYFNTMSTLGYYVRDLGSKYPERVGLFQGVNGWKIMSLFDWDVSIYDTRVIFKNRYKDFKDKQERDDWLEEYNKIKKRCLKNHLIL